MNSETFGPKQLEKPPTGEKLFSPYMILSARPKTPSLSLIEFGVRIVARKNLNWCTPFSGVSLCYSIIEAPKNHQVRWIMPLVSLKISTFINLIDQDMCFEDIMYHVYHCYDRFYAASH